MQSIARFVLPIVFVVAILGEMDKCRLCRFQRVPRSPYCLRHKNRLAEERKEQHRDAARARAQTVAAKVRRRAWVRGEGRFDVCQAKAKSRGLAWELPRETFAVLILSPCHYCGLALPESGSGLDRLDNARGYTVDNVVPCCTDCNLTRRNSFTPVEMRVIGQAIRKVKLARTQPIVDALALV